MLKVAATPTPSTKPAIMVLGMMTQQRDRHLSSCFSTIHELRIHHVLLDNKQPIFAQFMLSLISQVTVREIHAAANS